MQFFTKDTFISSFFATYYAFRNISTITDTREQVYLISQTFSTSLRMM
jgi:hypothetical protein